MIAQQPPPTPAPPHKGEGDPSQPLQGRGGFEPAVMEERFPPPCGEGLRVGVFVAWAIRLVSEPHSVFVDELEL
jgi:hypothetical protein